MNRDPFDSFLELLSGVDRSALIYTCTQRNGIEEAFSKGLSKFLFYSK